MSFLKSIEFWIAFAVIVGFAAFMRGRVTGWASILFSIVMWFGLTIFFGCLIFLVIFFGVVLLIVQHGGG
jgi:hypothetical protein